MRKTLVLSLITAALVISNLGISRADHLCGTTIRSAANTANPTDRATAPGSTTNDGSCKTASGAILVLRCADGGNLPGPVINGTRLWVTAKADGVEIEACNDGGGDKVTQGRLIVVISAAHGLRIALDSDGDNPQGGGGSFLSVQAAEEASGLFCSTKHGGADTPGDGYARLWASPGNWGGLGPQAADCRPNFIPV